MSDHVIVVGGGVIGAACAHWLAASGRRVTIVDRDRFAGACSHGNCGFVCPSHVLPLAAPGAIRKTMRLVLRRNSPLAIRPRLDFGLLRWFRDFAEHCNEDSMLEAAAARHALLQSSASLYRELLQEESIDCEWRDRGLLFVHRHERELDEFESTDRMLRERFGLGATRYDGRALTGLEPALVDGLAGAWHYECDAHLRPDRLLDEWRERLESRGVRIVERTPVSGVIREASRARALRSQGDELAADAFVIACGAETPSFRRELGCRLPIQPGKGYSITMARPAVCPSIPMIFEEHRVAVTPFDASFRLGSTMEFAGYDRALRPKRLRLLRDAARIYLREPHAEPVEEQWFGWRPMVPDGKPVIDRAPAFDNVWIAAGHGMLGLSMAPATGKLVAELVAGEPTHVDAEPYRVGRFF